jgi:cytochrome P450 family 2 subfamily J
MFISNGELWKTNRRFALHTLRDFGFGRNIMEAKIMKHADWLVEQFTQQANAKNAFNPAHDVQFAVGK